MEHKKKKSHVSQRLAIERRLLIASVSIPLLWLTTAQARAAIFTFDSSSYTYQYDQQQVNTNPSSRDGRIYGSFSYTPSTTSAALTGVDISVGGIVDLVNGNDIIGNYWEGPSNYTALSQGYGVNYQNATPFTYNMGSADAVQGNGSNRTQRLYFWYYNPSDPANNGRGISLLLRTPLANITPGSIYSQAVTSTTPIGLNDASNNYFCSAVIGTSGGLAGNGLASTCAANLGSSSSSGDTTTLNRKVFSAYTFSLTVPSPAIGLGLAPLLLLGVRHRNNRRRHQSGTSKTLQPQDR